MSILKRFNFWRRSKVISTHATREEAIVAAIDTIREGQTLFVHAEDCTLGTRNICSCKPVQWTC